MKKLLIGSLALAIIGGASSVGLYYQSLIIERKEKKETVEEFYCNRFCQNKLALYRKKDFTTRNESDYLIELMHKDGYSYGEIGIFLKSACEAARLIYEAEVES